MKGGHVGIFDGIERGLERAVNGAFARTFRSGVQPVEISAAIKRQLDIGAVIVDRDRVITPNRFVVKVSQGDYQKLQSLGETLERELRQVAVKYASKQGYTTLGQIDVQITPDERLRTGVLEIEPESVEGHISWGAALNIDGKNHELKQGTNVIGRGSDVDVRISDNGASRKHLEIDWNGSEAIARDLGSTNGSKVNGQRFAEAKLTPETVITVGQTHMKFVLLPQRQQQFHRKAGSNTNQTVQLPVSDADTFWRDL
nr:DUF3662 and FHA domain-containing protein [Leucobacter chinensis]